MMMLTDGRLFRFFGLCMMGLVMHAQERWTSKGVSSAEDEDTGEAPLSKGFPSAVEDAGRKVPQPQVRNNGRICSLSHYSAVGAEGEGGKRAEGKSRGDRWKVGGKGGGWEAKGMRWEG